MKAAPNLPQRKLLINLQYYEGDKLQACKLARLIADIEPARRTDVSFLFSCRHDCDHDQRTLKYVSTKFDVYTFKNKRIAIGWPYACNELWFGSMTHIANYAGIIGTYDAILCLEADDIPLTADWLDTLIKVWNSHRAVIMGHLVPAPGPHINGNCLVSGSADTLAKIRRVGSCSPSAGWDYELARKFKAWGWAHTDAIRSEWNRATVTEDYIDKLISEGVVLFHGTKDDSGLSIIQARLGKNKVVPEHPGNHIIA